jgi:hypothetical protein
VANLTRINNNQITDAVSGNTQFGINANTKVQARSITSTLLANNLTYGSDLTITGNLSVTGNVTAIDTTNTTIEDPLLLLASTQTSSPTVDIGYIGQRGTSNNIAFVWDESSTEFVTVYTDSGATDNTVVNILSYADFHTANANVGGNLAAGNLSLTGNVTSALNVTGNIAAGNIYAVGLISATGNIATANFFIGDGAYISNINAGNVASYKISNGNSSANIGTLDGNMVVTINGNLNSTFYDTGVSFVGNIVTGNSINAANLSLSGNIIGNLNVSGNIIPSDNAVYSLGNATSVWKDLYLSPNTLYVGPVAVGANATSNSLTINNNIAVTYQNGNADISASGNVSATGNLVTTAGSVNTANLSLSGNVLSNLNVTLNVTAGNVNAVTTVSAGGNVVAFDSVNSANLSLTGNVISTLNVTGNTNSNNVNITNTLSATGNAIAGNVLTGGLISAFGNVNSGNVITGNISATGNITANNISANVEISATGNVLTQQSFVGNALYGNTLIITSTAGGLLFSITGNINANSTYINNIPTPVQGGDAVNKQYVDDVVQGLNIHDSTIAATPNTLANISGGTVSYNNGNAGVGANLVTTGTYTNIDGVAINTVGTRILVKDEVDPAWNGVYTYSNSTVLIRATDYNTVPEIEAGDFVLNLQGNLYANTGWVQTSNTQVVGTDPIIFTQFSGAGQYTAGNAIALNGYQINVLTDGNTVGVNGSNQLYIPANAPLTTPNIGSATGANLSVTGSVIGNIFQADTLSVIGNASIGNITTGNLSIGGNVLTNLNVTTGIYANTLNITSFITTTGNIYGGNISSANIYATNISNGQIVFGSTAGTGLLTGNATLTTDGNNVVAGGNVSAGGNVTAANFTTSGVGGNITGANLISAVRITATGNIGAGNYLFGDGYYISNINAGNVASYKIINGNSYANIASSNGNLDIGIGSNSNLVAQFYDTGVLFGGNISVLGNVLGTLNVSGDVNANNISATANITAGNITTSGGSGNITGANVISAITITASGNVYGGNVAATLDISAGGNIYGNNIFSNAISSAGNIQSGTTLLVDTTSSSVSLGANVVLTTGATLAINATDSLLIPVGDTPQRPATPATGMLRFNSTLSACEVWNGAAWVAVGGSSYTVITNEQFNGDGSTVTFTLGSSQTTNSCIVTINGVVQIPTTAYSVSGTYPTCVLTFTEAPEVADIIDVREITTTTSVTAISNSPGNAIVSVSPTIGQVNIAGNLVSQLNATAPSLSANSTMSFQLVSNTSLAILVRGTDGVTRSTILTLS